MSEQRRQIGRRAFDVALNAVPGSLIEKVTAAGAPLTRYSGRTRVGANALASALAVLAQPPRRRRLRGGSVTLDAIAEELGRSEEEVVAWAAAGMLGERVSEGVWSSAAADRAALIDFMLLRGVPEQEVERASREGRLPLLALDRVQARDRSLTGRQVAERAGLPEETAVAIWRALGYPSEDLDTPIFTRREVEALRVIGALLSVFTIEDLVEAASVVGRAMNEVSAAALELIRRRVTRGLVDAGVGELEGSLRMSAISELLVPTLGPLLEVTLRRHLATATQADAALQIEMTGGQAGREQVETVGFADLVSFTTVTESMSPLEVGEVAARMLRAAEGAFAPRGVRIVKSIGDAVMFTTRDPLVSALAALDLIDAAGRDATLPPVRAGLANGPVLRAYADYFGRTVNLASRLCDAAAPGEVLLHATTDAVPPRAWEQAKLSATADSLRLKGIDGKVPVLRLTRAG
jgi:class 3 adenylate cyclase